jgi:hypothetical protein
MGTACWGWKIYDVGELSMMIVSFRSRPTWDRSYNKRERWSLQACAAGTYLDVVSLVIITAFSEQTVMNNSMNVQLVQQRITILVQCERSKQFADRRDIPLTPKL